MNIFEALSNGNGTVSETNTSSLGAYLFNLSEKHGFNKQISLHFPKNIYNIQGKSIMMFYT